MTTHNESPHTTGKESTRIAQDVAIGSRLRAVRQQTGLSRLGVETLSNGEFRSSVLRAYERGERAITVARLQTLAKLYRVPVSHLLRPEEISRLGWEEAEETERRSGSSGPTTPGRAQKVTIDLTRLGAGGSSEFEMLRRFISTVQMQRQDFNGRVITVRAEDVRKLACNAGTSPDAMVRRLEALGLVAETRAEGVHRRRSLNGRCG